MLYQNFDNLGVDTHEGDSENEHANGDGTPTSAKAVEDWKV